MRLRVRIRIRLWLRIRIRVRAQPRVRVRPGFEPRVRRTEDQDIEPLGGGGTARGEGVCHQVARQAAAILRGSATPARCCCRRSRCRLRRFDGCHELQVPLSGEHAAGELVTGEAGGGAGHRGCVVHVKPLERDLVLQRVRAEQGGGRVTWGGRHPWRARQKRLADATRRRHSHSCGGSSRPRAPRARPRCCGEVSSLLFRP